VVVVPVSVMDGWRREWSRIGGKSGIIRTYHGSNRWFDADIDRDQIIITTIGTLRSSWKRRKRELFQHEFDMMVLDEAHVLGNLVAAQVKNDKKKKKKKAKPPVYRAVFNALQYKFGLVITGTPYMNRTRDLQCLLRLMNCSAATSDDEKTVVTAFTTRSVRTDASKLVDEMPVLVHTELLVPFADETKKKDALGRAHEVRSLARRIASLQATGQPVHEATLLRLYKLKSEAKLLSIMERSNVEAIDAMTGADVAATAKGKLLLKELGEIKDDGVAIVSRYTSVLDAVGRMLNHADRSFVFYHGGLSQHERREVIAEYMEETNACHIILLSMDAAGVGLNLRGRHMYLLDSGNNHSVENQVACRFRRLGQTGRVNIKRVLMEAGIDHDMKQAKISKLVEASSVDPTAENELRDVYGVNLKTAKTAREEVLAARAKKKKRKRKRKQNTDANSSSSSSSATAVTSSTTIADTITSSSSSSSKTSNISDDMTTTRSIASADTTTTKRQKCLQAIMQRSKHQLRQQKLELEHALRALNSQLIDDDDDDGEKQVGPQVK